MPLPFFVLLILVAGALAAVSGLFSAIETAFFSLQPYHLERLKARRADFAQSLDELLQNPRRLLSAILLCDALVNLPLVIICVFLLRDALPIRFPFWAAALLIFTVVVFLGDLIPKMFALAEPYRTAKAGVRIMRRLMPFVDPAARVLQQLSEKAANALTPAHLTQATHLSEEELGTLVELSTEEGALHETESEMIQEIIKLGDKTARHCMTPRVDVFTVSDDWSDEELRAELSRRRIRRVPVYGETPDEIVGILDVRKYLLAGGVPYTEMLLPPSFVPETMRAFDLLRSFLTRPQALAIVVDEHGGTEGIITLTDIIEEIISDAVPQAERSLYIETVGPGRLIVNGSARLSDVNELISVHLEEEGIDTIGGLVFNRLGSLPTPGAEVHEGRVKIVVRRISKKRVEEVLIVEEPSAEAEGEEEDAQ